MEILQPAGMLKNLCIYHGICKILVIYLESRAYMNIYKYMCMYIYIYILNIARQVRHNFVHQQYVKWQNWGQSHIFFVSFIFLPWKVTLKKNYTKWHFGFLLRSKVLLSTVFIDANKFLVIYMHKPQFMENLMNHKE